jgi:hypothetical protein
MLREVRGLILSREFALPRGRSSIVSVQVSVLEGTKKSHNVHENVSMTGGKSRLCFGWRSIQ